MSREGILCFIVGAAFGAVLTYSHMEKTMKRELETVKAEAEEEKEQLEERVVKAEQATVEALKNPYVTFSKEEDTKIKEMRDMRENHLAEVDYEILKPDEFADNGPGYDQVDLTYHTEDGILEENGAIIEDIEYTIGPDMLDHIGDFEPNVLYVRNHILKTDYVVTEEQNWFSDGEEDVFFE